MQNVNEALHRMSSKRRQRRRWWQWRWWQRWRCKSWCFCCWRWCLFVVDMLEIIVIRLLLGLLDGACGSFYSFIIAFSSKNSIKYKRSLNSLCVGWRNLHTLHVGWRNLFSSCAVCCVSFWFWREIGFGCTYYYVLGVPYSCGVVLVCLVLAGNNTEISFSFLLTLFYSIPLLALLLYPSL